MKKHYLFFILVTMLIHGIEAQEKNYRDKFLLVTKEIEVGDTLKAKAKAEEASKIEREKRLQLSAWRKEIINIIDSLTNNKIKKTEDEKSLNVFRDALLFKRGKYLFFNKYEEIAYDKGKLNDERSHAYEILEEYKYYQEKEYEAETKKVNYDWREFLTFHKETITEEVANPNYREGYTDIDAEWEFLQQLESYGNDKLRHIKNSFPKAEDYYVLEELSNYRLHQSGDVWYACDNEERLVGVKYIGVEKADEEEILQAAMLYDYEQNKYNIKNENQSVYRWVPFLIKGDFLRSGTKDNNTTLRSFVNGIASNLTKTYANIEYMFKRGKIPQSLYNDYMKRKVKGKKYIDDLNRNMPSEADHRRALEYVMQLVSDNESKLVDFKPKRQSGTQILLLNDDESLKVMLTYSLDDENKIEKSFKIIEKGG